MKHRTLDGASADKFVGMYVDHWILDYGEKAANPSAVF
jgi:hypothetical protein